MFLIIICLFICIYAELNFWFQLFSFDRYINLNPENQEEYRVGLFVHLVDKIQAARFGMANVFQSEESNGHFNGNVSLEKLLEFTIPLLQTLPNAAQIDLITFVGEEIDEFRNHNLPKIAQQGLQVLHAYAQNPTRNP